MAVWVERKAIEKVVEQIANCHMIKRFYPTIIAKRSGMPLDKVFKYLMDFVDDGMLILKWEIRCSDYNCARTVRTVSKIPKDGTIVDCICGDEVEVTIDNVFPVFEVSLDYRDSIGQEKKELKKKSCCTEQPLELAQEALKGAVNFRNILPSEIINQFPENATQTIFLQVNQNCVVGDQGGAKMGEKSYNFSGAKIDTKQGNFAVGEDITNTNSIIFSESDIVQKLLDQVKNLDINSEKKEELKEAIQATNEQVCSSKPSKFTIKSMLGAFDAVMQSINKTPELIGTISQWKSYVEQFIS